ncbi:hypothetical protein B4064_3745 [Caldibacillus thermoamylovorans]|uniref:Uncharacterized protein n=1 Tax=Caldibacillus thermoamylovorans TaxID=35841 RepID=A0A0D0F5I6_9BACI|nr:hypothetical protein B4065_3956 [Caldibacillus thermoamylovorans]KIO58336.1 hypothetical protein B4064_3745 [Caldibacillus thermoamylovorans]KIO69527.1 hypothetical protein B4166_1824 [Caldibacillus thermoamylovorans]KIO72623.1 hypothetical protein B4167_2925 [Caldibacillus thermoamylovorans]
MSAQKRFLLFFIYKTCYYCSVKSMGYNLLLSIILCFDGLMYLKYENLVCSQ